MESLQLDARILWVAQPLTSHMTLVLVLAYHFCCILIEYISIKTQED